MNKKLLTAVVGATLVAATGTANAIDLKISGFLHRAVMWADDGNNSQTYHVDPTSAPSRIRFLASDDLVPGVKAGVNWENGYNSNRSNTVSQTVRFDNPTGLSERWQEIWFSGAFGKVSIGQGNSASKDGHGSDLSGTDLSTTTANVADWGAGLFFVNSATGALSATTVGSVISTFEGSRFDRVRYDSPALGPVVLSAASGNANNNDWADFAVRVNTDLGGAGQLVAAVYYAKIKVASATTGVSDGTGNTEHTGFSASWLSPMGLNVTLSYANKEDEHPTIPLDAKYTKLKVGYKMGEHAVSVDFARGEDQTRSATVSEEADAIGLGYNWKPKPWADVYAGVRIFSLDRDAADFDDIKMVVGGTRITF